jgi:hypothetical protein
MQSVISAIAGATTVRPPTLEGAGLGVAGASSFSVFFSPAIDLRSPAQIRRSRRAQLRYEFCSR